MQSNELLESYKNRKCYIGPLAANAEQRHQHPEGMDEQKNAGWQQKWEDRAYALIEAIPVQQQQVRVVLSWAQSLNGVIGHSSPTPLSLSCRESFLFTHALRSSSDAILLGITTVLKDMPLLSTRLVRRGPNKSSLTHPRPVVIDPYCQLPCTARFIHRRPIVLCIKAQRQSELVPLGVTIVEIPTIKGRIDLHAAMDVLFKMSIKTLMVEGGAKVLQEFIRQKCYHHLLVTICPRWITGDVQIGHYLDLASPTYHVFGKDMILESAVETYKEAPG